MIASKIIRTSDGVPVWTSALEYPSESAAIDAARDAPGSFDATLHMIVVTDGKTFVLNAPLDPQFINRELPS